MLLLLFCTGTSLFMLCMKSYRRWKCPDKTPGQYKELKKRNVCFVGDSPAQILSVVKRHQSLFKASELTASCCLRCSRSGRVSEELTSLLFGSFVCWLVSYKRIEWQQFVSVVKQTNKQQTQKAPPCVWQ